MDFTSFVSVNGPCSIITTITNVFLGYCILFPQQENERLKQPLNVLLGTLVLCNITLQVCVLFFTLVYLGIITAGYFEYSVLLETVFFTMRTSVTSSLWLSVFYYCQIVPARCCLFVFLKKHIKVFIYSALIAEKVFYLSGYTVGIINRTAFLELSGDLTYEQWDAAIAKLDFIYTYFIVDLWMRCGFSFLCLCLMFASSCATIVYLRKHMMSKEGKSSSDSARIQRQMRLTITGIVQSLLYFVCLVYMTTNDILENIFYIFIEWDYYIILTVSCLYSFGATINLCVGQTIFRQRIFQVWKKFFKVVTCCVKPLVEIVKNISLYFTIKKKS